MSLALTGLILLQAYWIRHDLKVKEEQFGHTVMMAMNSIVEKLEETENKKIVVRHFLTGGDSLDISSLNTDSLIQVMAALAAVPEAPLPPPAPPSPIGITNVQEQMETNIRKLRQPLQVKRDEVTLPGRSDSALDIRIERDIEQKEVYAVQLASDEARIDSIVFETEKRMASRMRKLSTMMQKFTFQVSDRSQNIYSRVDTIVLDSIVRTELANHDIHLPYAYAIGKEDDPHLVFGKSIADSAALKESGYRLPLFPGDFIKRNEVFLLAFGGKINYLLMRMWPLLLCSFVFTSVIFIGFWYTMYVILRQKKLASVKNDFINNMTHEFKTPIATIAIANESIRDSRVNTNPEKLEYYTSVIRDENQRMLKQVENVLQMAQIDKGELVLKKEEIDMADVLQKAVQSSMLSVQQREGSLELELPAQPLKLPADGNHFLNVFTNLIDNAMKYSPEAPDIKLKAEVLNEQLVISIRDRGIGMSRDVQKRIFNTFYRATTGNIHDVKGFGLGLSYVKAIVEAHNGAVSVNSDPGQGSTFIISLPINS